MNSTKETAIIVGVLFIIATVAAILGSLAITKPNLDDPDYLIKFSANKNQVLIGVLCSPPYPPGLLLLIFKSQNGGLFDGETSSEIGSG